MLTSSSSSFASYVTILSNLVHLSLPPAPVSFNSFLGNSTKLAGLPRTWDGLELSSEADGDDGLRKKERGKERTGEREQEREGWGGGEHAVRWKKGRMVQKRSEECKERDPRILPPAARKKHLRNRCRLYVRQGEFSRACTPRLMIHLYDHKRRRLCTQFVPSIMHIDAQRREVARFYNKQRERNSEHLKASNYKTKYVYNNIFL